MLKNLAANRCICMRDGPVICMVAVLVFLEYGGNGGFSLDNRIRLIPAEVMPGISVLRQVSTRLCNPSYSVLVCCRSL